MQRWVVACFLPLLLGSVFADECPNGGHCKDGLTCCQHPANGYECCPFDTAECCGDHVHCCPAWMSCDVEKSRCVNATLSVPWAERTPTEQPSLSRSFRMIKSYIGEDDDNICPDQSRCPAEFSCLRALTKYGCCPLAQGIPCSDGKHCCPQGHSCSADSRSCVKKDVSSTVLCSDGVSECPEESSCCEGTDGQFGCCPMPQAVCCDDKVHCCPKGSLCDLETSKCVSVSSKKQLPMWAKFPARRRADWEDQKEEQHVTSEAAADTENEEGKAESLATKTVSAVLPGEHAGNVPCDRYKYCADGYTCCTNLQQQWFCCPLPNAVCCNDFAHCCPFHTTCNLVHFQCLSGNTSTPMSRNIPAITIAAPTAPAERQVTEPALSEQTENSVVSPGERASDVQCNATAACPDETTCCPAKETGWFCCPAPSAVCCSDLEHCCPHGMTCNVAQQRCDSSNSLMTPMSRNIPFPTERQVTEPALSEQTENSVVSPGERTSDVPCNDTAACPDDTTCCTTKEGEWACCPAPNAVCCSDHEHCCPQGTTCDLVHDTCADSSNSQTTPMSRKTPAFTIAAPSAPAERHVTEPALNSVVSPGERTSDVQCNATAACPDETTCCPAEGGGWFCCPAPLAVCCSDLEHCCPHGMTCNVAQQRCDSSNSLMTPMSRNIPAFPTERQVTEPALSEQTENSVVSPGERTSDVQCNATAACPDETTCCTTKEGEWACCPDPNAVCCSDHETCCPHGTTCDDVHDTCVDSSNSQTTPMRRKMPAMQRVTGLAQSEKAKSEEDEGEDEEDVEGRVQCKSHKKSACPRNSTCCRSGCRRRRCCPLPHGTCCRDGKHCCPHKYKCCHRNHTCVKDEVEIPWYTKTPALSIPKQLLSVKSQVSELQQTESEEDEEEDGDDEDDDDDDDDDDDEDIEHVHCCKNSTCPTCCGKKNNKFCCQHSNATCCHGNHCCPQGYKCCYRKHSCVKDEVEIPWYTSVPVLSIPEPQPTVESQVTEPQQTEQTESEEDDDDDDGDDDDVETLENEPRPTGPGQSEDEEGEADADDVYEDDEDDDVYEDDEDEAEDDLVHCDHSHSCPKGTTCCDSGNGWGCCPLPRAVCCSDGKHCCPYRYRCSKFRGACVRDDNVVIPWYTKLPALSEPDSVKDVECSVGDRCPEYSTCCQLSSGKYGCCPMENAVCCSDGKHCCPTGFSCDDGDCVRAVILELEFVPLSPAVSEPLEKSGVRCGRDTCSDDGKCCRNRGMFYCCPYKTGMCCNTRYCCPPDQECAQDGQCKHKSVSLRENWPFFFKRDEENPLIL